MADLWRLGKAAVRAATGPTRRLTLAEVTAVARNVGSPHVTMIDSRELPFESEFVAVLPSDANGAIISGLIRMFGYHTAFEIGTYKGATTRTLAAAGCRVWSLDLPDPDARHTASVPVSNPNLFETWERGTLLAGTPEAERVTLLQGDSGTFDFSEWKERVDLIFIDASHDYEAVVNDTNAARSMLAPRGMIVWDDYPQYTGVWRAVNEFATGVQDPVYSVRLTRLALYRDGGIQLVPAPGMVAAPRRAVARE